MGRPDLVPQSRGIGAIPLRLGRVALGELHPSPSQRRAGDQGLALESGGRPLELVGRGPRAVGVAGCDLDLDLRVSALLDLTSNSARRAGVAVRIMASDSFYRIEYVKAADQVQIFAETPGGPVAVGAPLGFAGSVSAGIVSGLGRTLPTRDGEVVRLVEDVIQTDASFHPGNSGGALADAHGRVVGVATALVGPGFGQGLGLAVPINERTLRIVGQLIADGRVHRAWLGVAGGLRPLPPRAAAATGLDVGIEVLQVVPDSPADQAGVRPEDILVRLDGTPVRSIGQLQELLDRDRISRQLPLEIVRGGQAQTLQVEPAEL